jgi:hypothetical protein
MDATPEQTVASDLDDVRTAPLTQVSTAGLLRRLRPKTTPGSDRVPVAAFNASL